MGIKTKKIKFMIVTIFILLAILLDYVPLYEQYESMVTYVIKPLTWVLLLVGVVILFKDEYLRNKKYEKDILFYVLIATIVYFIMYFFVGYVENFSHNPYNRSLTGLIINVWTFGSVIISKEYLRYYLINNCDKKRVYLYGILISIMFAFSEINKINFMNNFETVNNFTRFLIEGVMAEMFVSLFLTYVAYYSSYKATLIYRLVPLLFTLTLSILPNINWMLSSLVKAFVPFFAYLFINNAILKIDNKKMEQKDYKYGTKFWIITLFLISIPVSFGLGFLPYYPVVIATGSMEPGINVGDIVIVKKEKYDSVKVQDVIEYKASNYTVIHRVISKRDDNTLITKGDNNDSIDPLPIKQGQVNGVVKARIPYLGYPTLFFNTLFGHNLKDEVTIETGDE